MDGQSDGFTTALSMTAKTAAERLYATAMFSPTMPDILDSFTEGFFGINGGVASPLWMKRRMIRCFRSPKSRPFLPSLPPYRRLRYTWSRPKHPRLPIIGAPLNGTVFWPAKESLLSIPVHRSAYIAALQERGSLFVCTRYICTSRKNLF